MFRWLIKTVGLYKKCSPILALQLWYSPFLKFSSKFSSYGRSNQCKWVWICAPVRHAALPCPRPGAPLRGTHAHRRPGLPTLVTHPWSPGRTQPKHHLGACTRARVACQRVRTGPRPWRLLAGVPCACRDQAPLSLPLLLRGEVPRTTRLSIKAAGLSLARARAFATSPSSATPPLPPPTRRCPSAHSSGRLTIPTPRLDLVQAQIIACCSVVPRASPNFELQRRRFRCLAVGARRSHLRPNSGHQRPRGELLVISRYFPGWPAAGSPEFRPGAPPLSPRTTLQGLFCSHGPKCKERAFVWILERFQGP
jgi:hypothetical protein